MGLERLVEQQPQDYIGKAALEELRVKGVDRKLVGIELDGDELRAEMSEYWTVSSGGKEVGHMTDAVWSPGLKKNIGYVWVPIGLAEPGTASTSRPRTAITSRARRRPSRSSTLARRSPPARWPRRCRPERGTSSSHLSVSIAEPLTAGVSNQACGTPYPRPERTPSMRRTMIALGAALAVSASACSVSLGDSTSEADPAGLNTGISDQPVDTGKEPVAGVVDRVLPAVVNVTTDVYQPDGTSGQGVGTGFIVREDGVIVTNCHVVEGGSRLTVFLSDKDRTEYEARLIGADCLNDLAVLDIDEEGLPTVPLGNSGSLRLGQRVVALGYALGLEGGPTVTSGIVSSLDRTIDAQDPGCATETCGRNQVRTYPSVIQTDAAINPGNSGGPLVDMRGRVIGINSAGNKGAENIGFAIKIDFVKDTIESSIDDPLAATGYLGVSTTALTADLRFQQGLDVEAGAYVVGTLADGPADEVGIGEGDVIVSVDGTSVRTPDDLGTVLDALAPGDTVSVELVEAGGETRTVEVELAARPLPVDIP